MLHTVGKTGWDRTLLERRIREYGEWFHNHHFGEVQTAPDHPLGDYPRQKFRRFARALPEDLSGQTVLDVGCNGGFYSVEMARRGADRVVAIDTDARYLAQARFAAEVSGAVIDFRQMSVYEVASLGERFDLVLFLGVLYHLRYPLLALDLLHDHVVKDRFVCQSMLRGAATAPETDRDYPFSERAVFERPGYPAMYFVERRYADDPTNWWIPNGPCLEAMLRAAGFMLDERAEEEVFICRRGARPALEDL